MGCSADCFAVDSMVHVRGVCGRNDKKVPVKIFRLKGKGFPGVNTYERGDQLIHVNVWTPQHVTPEEKSMLEKLNDSPNFQPKPDKNERSFFDKVREMFS